MLTIIQIQLALKTIKNILIIFNGSFFVGVIWIIICYVTDKVKHYREEEGTAIEDTGDFIDVNELKSYSNYDQAIIVVYFAFTSLSTVGFGDFHPINSNERLFGVVILVFGVSIFSICMNNFNEMIANIKEFNETLDDGHNLSRFFSLCENFNHGKPLNQQL